MNNENNISQASAEMLLNYLFPEMDGQWLADNKGSFYRNYNSDILALYANEKRVELSRDGFLKLLPQGLIGEDNELRNAKDVQEKSKELEQRKHLLHEAFLPLDTLHFRRYMQIEQKVAALLSDKMEYILKQYFDFNLATEQNHYVRSLAVLMPFAKNIRANMQMLRHILSTLLGCQVIMTQGRYSESDSTRCWMPMVRYDLIMPGLDAETYKARSAELEPLANFIREWFIPAEVYCQIKIKEYGQPQRTNMRLTLNYNTEVEK